MSDTISKHYGDFLQEIKDKIRTAQYEAAKVVNTTIISLYWDIGKGLTEKLKTGWGKAVVETLADDIQKEFPGIQGFSSRNIRYMVKFYEQYVDNEILQPLVAEISWSKHLVIICKSKKRTIVEYALKDSNKPIGVATYTLTGTLPESYRMQLPSTDEIARKLESFIEMSKNK